MKECFEKPAMDIMKFSNSIYTFPCNVNGDYMYDHFYPDENAAMAFIASHCAGFDPNSPGAWD